MYCSVIATLFHFGGEFVDVVLILSEGVRWVGGRWRKEKDVMGKICVGVVEPLVIRNLKGSGRPERGCSGLRTGC